MIKTVLFDLGNVILPFDVMRLAKRLMQHSPYSALEIVEKLWNDRIADEFETGKMSNEEYFKHVCDVCQFTNLTYEEFLPIFNAIFDEDAGVVELIHSLKKKYKLGLISNTNAIHVKHILAEYPSLHKFDRHWFSNEVQLRKPNPKIYQLALDHFTVTPSEAVFIDDMPANIHAAKEIGINAIHYQNLPQLKRDLTQLGVDH